MIRMAPMSRYSLLAGCLLAAGCGDPNRATVGGTVLLDGKPLPQASVQFWPKSDMNLGVYSGQTGPEGKFELTARLEKYVKPGVYIALVAQDVKTKDGKLPTKDDDMMLLAKPGAMKNVLPKKYFDRANPVFIVEVKPGANELAPFELASK
jgi:hypothetical protein